MTETQLGEHWIDDVADRFEDAWRMGLRPLIEDYLNGDLKNCRAALLEELVCVDVHRRRRASEAPALAEYQVRFPDDPAAVEAGFQAATAPGPRIETEQVCEPIGAQILLGILALQHNLVGRDALLSAFQVWVGDKSRGLGEILVERGDLTAVRLALLEAFAVHTLRRYDGDVNKSLASRGALETIRDDLARLHDAEMDATLTVPPADAGTVTDRGASTGERIRPVSRCFPENRFRLIKKITSGGQGDIILAMDEALNRKVALKRIKKQFAYSADLQARLLVEAEVAARLEHPAFPPVHFAGFDGKGRPYFVMRYIEGDRNFERDIEEFHGASSSARLPDDRAQGLRKLLRHFVDVCYAVAFAHDRGVIHRDIKPANVLVGQFGETYLVDWGMVKFAERSPNPGANLAETLRPSPAHGSIFTVEGGTLHYMSPEQIARMPIDFATDVYSLGATLYTLLTGQRAFAGKNRAEVAVDIEHGRFKHPRTVESRVPAALEAICLKAMRLRPEERYTTAKEMARDLEDWLDDRPIPVYREPWPVRARRWARNHKPAMASLVVVFFTSIVCLVVADTLLRREQARTETNFRLARDAVLRLVRLARIPPKSKEVRDDIARTAIDSNLIFLKSRPHDQGVRLNLAQTYRLVANMGRTVGEFDDPKKLYQEGADLLGRLRAELPSDPAIVEEQSLNSIDTAELWFTNGHPARAKVILESVLAQLDAMGTSVTSSLKRVKSLALLNLATALNETDGSQRARELGIRAVELLTSLGDDGPRQPEEALILAHTQVGLAEMLLENPRGSEEWFTKAIEEGEALIKAEHDTPEVKHAYACALRQRAERSAADADPERRDKALGEYTWATLLLGSLVEEHPHVPRYHRDLAISRIRQVDIRMAGGIIDQLTVKFNADGEEEIGLYAGSRDLFDYHRHLGQILAQRARFARAKGDLKGADSLFGRAVEEHRKALQANSESRIDRLLRESVSRERDTPH
jgi:serine/threonine protein kinase/tetratricopeptide (TPR) repeat protein